MDSIYVSGSSSSAHTYGNVASLLKECLKSYFPENFFQYIRISTELLSNEMKEERLNNDLEFLKQQYPRMIFTPNFDDIKDDDRFLGGTYLTNGATKFNHHIDKRWMFDLFTDQTNNLYIKYGMNRDRLTFNVNIVVDTLFNQLDLYKNMLNLMNWNSPFYINSSLESMIPRSMIEYVAKMNNIDMDNHPGVVLELLNHNSKYPITYKTRNSTSRDEYFLYYDIKLLTTFSDLELSDTSKKNNADTYFTLTFRVTVDFNLPSVYYLVGDEHNKLDGFAFEAVIKDSYQHDLIPVYTIYNLFNGIKPDNESFVIYKTAVFKTELENKWERDSLCFANLMNPAEIHEVIKTHIAGGVPISLFMEIKLLENNKLVPKENFEIDWNEEKLTIFRSNPDSTYRLVIFVNSLYLNKKIKEIMDRRKLDKSLNPNLKLDN
jgi:hypothetical protein